MGLIGHGSKFQIGVAGSPETFTDVAGTTAIDLGSNKIDTLDNTNMGSTGIKRTFEGGLEDEGDVTVKINIIPGDTSQTLLFATKDGLVHDFKVVYPGAVKTVAFSGIISGIDESIPDDKKPTYSVKVKVSGAKTVTTT